MSFNDAKKITAQYLDGKGQPFVVDQNSFMDTGGGRFVVGSQFELINNFFNADIDKLPPGEYTKKEVGDQFALKTYYIEIQQYNFRDTNDDYLERTYIYNSLAFKISDGATFVVDEDGNKSIKNYAIEPYIQDGSKENFDFKSDDPLTTILNIQLEKIIDPSKVGSTVEIQFDGERTAKSTYTQEDLQKDIEKSSSWGDANFLKLRNDLSILAKQMQAEGIIESKSYKTSSIDSTISSSNETFSGAVANAIRRIDPLIIDLNGDGLKLSSWQESGVTFDLNGDGFSESTGWTTASSDDAFLVLDKNSNGNVDSIDELFGNSSSTGFEVLKKFDSNADNLINSNDAQFNLLKLWKDSNANGVVNEGELTSLLESGITEISLKTLNNLYSSSGNLVTETAEVKITDPNNSSATSTRTISEVLFAMNQFNSSIVNPDEALGPNFTLDVNTLLLPYSRGYGSLNSWQVAMTLNSDLLETAQALANLSPTNFYQINSLFETFLFQWAGVEDFTSAQVYESGTSTKIDHRKVAFLEKATGLDFRVPNDAVISQAQTSWDLFYNTLLTRFLTQGTFKEIFPDASYSFSTDTTSINTSLDEAITNILSLSVSLDRNSFLNYAYYSKTILQLNKDQFTSETNTSFDTKVNDMLNSIINSVSIPNFSFNGIFNIGTDASETLYGAVNSDILKGESGEDFIYAESGNDYIEGNEGSDYLKGGAGDDIYKFNLGDGQDTIEETSGTDKIVFGTGITQTSLAFARIGVDLLISIGSGSDKIGIKNFYSVTTNRVETIEFYDGTQFSLASLGNITYGTVGNDIIVGTELDDILNGAEGNDTIYANSGNDIIEGGKGDDYAESNDSGNDTYIFNIGDGDDDIYDYAGTDKIIFGAGITQADITLASDYVAFNNNGLIINIGTSGDRIYIRQFFENNDNSKKIETLQFADGSTMSLVNGLNLQGSSNDEIIYGTSASDIITGNSGNDTIYANNGNDTVTGGQGNDYAESNDSGNDTYIFNIGDGEDDIYDYGGTDKIIFGAGITQADITIAPHYIAGNNNGLIIRIGTNGDRIYIRQFFENTDNGKKIETLQFADGSIMSLVNGLNLQGSSNDEIIYGTSASDIINGNSGNDAIYAGDGSDTLEGGKGDDYFESHDWGDDTYIFNLGDGQDALYDFQGNDKIVFGEGITQADITLIPNVAMETSLIIKIGTGRDQINIFNFFKNSDNTRKIETLQFADGSTMNLTGALTLKGSKVEGEVIVGTQYSDTIIGNIGNDAIYAGEGDDIIEGGKGDDYFQSDDGGNETYIFNLGDGQDALFDLHGDDKIVFGEGITQADITLIPDIASNNALIIKVGTGRDQIMIFNFFQSPDRARKIETLQFADGSTIDLSGALTLKGSKSGGEVIIGTLYSDTIIGNIGNDAIYAGEGDDIIEGGKGDDYFQSDDGGNETYIFNLGDGQDALFDLHGDDKIVFGEGITQADITLIPDIASNNALIIKVGTGRDQIMIFNFFQSPDRARKIETLQFADGSTIDLSGALTLKGSKSGGEVIIGTLYSDTIIGNIGNDTIYAGDGSDTIIGNIGDDAIYAGEGDDIIEGGKDDDYFQSDDGGNDTYIFNLGDGQDALFDLHGDDKIVFGEGITQADITLIPDIASNNALIIKIGTGRDQIMIFNFFQSPDRGEIA